MWNSSRHAFRLFKVGLTLARHDALFPLELIGSPPLTLRLVRGFAKLRPASAATSNERPGARLARALQELGPAYIKFGQALATRPDLVGDDIALDLANLQDHLPPFPGAEARRIIAEELGRPTETLFAAFDDQPVAAASIAQVHFAETADGRKVAVKVLRPGIERAFARDLESFRWLAAVVHRRHPPLRRLRPMEIVETFARTVTMEMDLRYEAAAASELRENSAAIVDYDIPDVIWTRTAQRVLTLERVDGIPMSDAAALHTSGLDLTRLAETVVRAFLEQAMFHGFFHADLHPGNLFATRDGRVVAVDFGIVGRLDPATRRSLAEIIYGFLHRDYTAVADAHFRAGYVPPDQSRPLFAQALRAIGEPITDRPAREISFGGLMAQLLKTTETFSMQTQPQLLLLQKTMMMVEGVAYRLDPEVNMWAISRPVIERWIRENLGPKARVRDHVQRTLALAERLPELLEDASVILAAARNDGLRLSSETMEPFTTRNGAATWVPFLFGALGGAVGAGVVFLLLA